ncbi:MAG: response regulator, partial [Bdellovibrionales bacterium]
PVRSNPADFRHQGIPRKSSSHKNPSRIPRQALFRVLWESGYTLICQAIELFLKQYDYEVALLTQASDVLPFVFSHKGELDAIILDRELPDINGLDLAKELQNNNDTKKIPIIMQTGSDQPEEIREGIEAGVYYYLSKPLNTDVLQSILDAAVKESIRRRSLAQELTRFGASFSLIEVCNFKYRTLEEAEALSAFLANCYPERDRVVSGIAALLINAVEHGICAIGYGLKGTLVNASRLNEEINKRLSLSKNRNQYVDVTYRRDEGELYLNIRDPGEGFDWKKYIQIDPSRSLDNHGRGIALAASVSFDRILYNDKGNEVTAYVRLEKPLDW